MGTAKAHAIVMFIASFLIFSVLLDLIHVEYLIIINVSLLLALFRYISIKIKILEENYFSQIVIKTNEESKE